LHIAGSQSRFAASIPSAALIDNGISVLNTIYYENEYNDSEKELYRQIPAIFI
jgi:hypothetical protein